MGRSNNKIASGAQAAAAASSRPPEGSAQRGHPEAPRGDNPLSTDWFSNLTPEEQQVERERMEVRKQKAQVTQQRMEQDRVSKAREVRQQALSDGIIEADQWNDGYYYVPVAKDTWKQIDNGTYYCTFCDAQLHEGSLGAHLHGERHRQRRLCPPGLGGPAAACLRPPPPQRPAGDEYEGPPLEEWQEWDPANGCVRCKACNKLCDGVHETTKEHLRRQEGFMWQLHSTHDMYKAPVQPWLAWVPDEGFGSGKYLRCLLCKKWVSDFEELDTTGYNGSHGDESASNQKDHAKRLTNLEMYEEELAEERRKWHPEAGTSGASASTYARSTAGVINPGTIGGVPSPLGPSTLPPVPTLPSGWRAAWDEKHQQYYYYATGREEAQWDVPTEEVRPVVLIEC